MMAEQNKLGFFGKIPIKGDFVSRHLPRSFVDPWDQWLQESIATSRDQLSDHWLESYLTSPIWRFVLSKGACDDNAWIGIVMPSVDNVGRYFPLTLATPVNAGTKLLSIADQEESWFSQAEHVALSALDQNETFDAFNQNIDDLGLPEHLQVSANASSDSSPNTSSTSSNHWHITMSESESMSTNLNSLTEHLLQKSFPNFSLWWTSGSEKVEPSILICNKLPPAPGFSALLTANWEHWGWDNKLFEKPFLKTDENKTANAVEEEITSKESSPTSETTVPL